jgi:hypothetical protein
MGAYFSNVTGDNHRSGSTTLPRQNIDRTRSKEMAADAADFSRELSKQRQYLSAILEEH